MAQTIYWSPPTNANTGSVLVYRATDNIADYNGSRTLIDTIAAKSGTTWVTYYTDTSGTVDNYYRIQFYDDVGSSELSDPISGEYSELLASFDDVAKVLRLTSNSDLGSDEVYAAIQDATNQIYNEYGDPIRNTYTTIGAPSSNSYPGSDTYSFTGTRQPVYQLREMLVGITDMNLVSGSSYTLNKNEGWVKFTSAFLTAQDGNNCVFHWVPQIYNDLCKNLAALQLIETARILETGKITTPEADRINKRIEGLRKSLTPNGIYAPKQIEEYNPFGLGDYINQPFR